MPNYIITQKAGPYVAGQRNTGVGTRLILSERAAEHELRLGTLIEENADVLVHGLIPSRYRRNQQSPQVMQRRRRYQCLQPVKTHLQLPNLQPKPPLMEILPQVTKQLQMLSLPDGHAAV